MVAFVTAVDGPTSPLGSDEEDVTPGVDTAIGTFSTAVAPSESALGAAGVSGNSPAADVIGGSALGTPRELFALRAPALSPGARVGMGLARTISPGPPPVEAGEAAPEPMPLTGMGVGGISDPLKTPEDGK